MKLTEDKFESGDLSHGRSLRDEREKRRGDAR